MCKCNKKALNTLIQVIQSFMAGAIRIELISLVLETKAQPLYQTPRTTSLLYNKKNTLSIVFARIVRKISQR